MQSAFRRLLTAAILAASPAVAWAQGAPMFDGFLDDNSEEISINGDLLEWVERDGRDVIVYTGNVVAIRGDMQIRASVLAVYLPVGESEETFDRMEITGGVTIRAGDQEVSADQATMDMVAETMVMTGNVRVDTGNLQVDGDRFTVNLATGDWIINTARTRVSPDP